MSDQYQKYLHVKVSINGNELHSFSFEEQEVKIGRGSDCQVVLDNPGISRVHATLQREGDNVRIIDQESGNGTFVNGNSVEKAWVSGADTLRIGKFTLSVRVSALQGNLVEPKPEEDVEPSVSEDQTISLSPDERKKILQQAQALRATAKPVASKKTFGISGTPLIMLFVAGTLFGLFVSWLFGG